MRSRKPIKVEKEFHLGRLDSRIKRELGDETSVKDFIAIRALAEPLLNILQKVLTNELERAIISSEDEGLTKLPDYGIIQADKQGYRRGIRHALRLLTMKDSE